MQTFHVDHLISSDQGSAELTQDPAIKEVVVTSEPAAAEECKGAASHLSAAAMFLALGHVLCGGCLLGHPPDKPVGSRVYHGHVCDQQAIV
jgi:hypothetical protein